MSYSERKELLKEWSKIRNRPIITYVTSIRNGSQANICSDSISEIINIINRISKEFKEIDFMIISNGGDPITSYHIINILRERFDYITVVVPYVAFSAATILAIGADDILMHPFSNLGPVDIQLTVWRPNSLGQNVDIHYSTEDIRNYICFLKEDVGITDSSTLASIVTDLSSEIGPINLGKAKQSQLFSLNLCKKIMRYHLSDENEIESVTKKLNSSFYRHDYTISRREAQEIGLKILSATENEEKLMWMIWQDYSDEMKVNTELNISNDLTRLDIKNESKSFSDINEISDQQNIHKNIYEFNTLLASIESVYISYEVRKKYRIIYWKKPDTTLEFKTISYSDGWTEVDRSIND